MLENGKFVWFRGCPPISDSKSSIYMIRIVHGNRKVPEIWTIKGANYFDKMRGVWSPLRALNWNNMEYCDITDMI
jgi:hypothetical protein